MITEKTKIAYNAVPKCWFECLKWCYECCTSINFTNEEKEEMEKEMKKNGYEQVPWWKWKDYCEYLNKDWKCSVYWARPFICRAFWNYKMPFMTCNHFAEEIHKWNWAKDNFYDEEINYIKEMFWQGSPMNEGWACFRETLPPEEAAISKWPKGIVPYAGLILKMYLGEQISEDKMTKILGRLEWAMKLANDSLENYFSIKII